MIRDTSVKLIESGDAFFFFFGGGGGECIAGFQLTRSGASANRIIGR